MSSSGSPETGWAMVLDLGRPYEVNIGDQIIRTDGKIKVGFLDHNGAAWACQQLKITIERMSVAGATVVTGEVIKGEDHDGEQDHDQPVRDSHMVALPEAVVPEVLPGDRPG